MKPRLEACYFGDGADGEWPRLARVLAYTAARHCPGWDTRVLALSPPPRTLDPFAADHSRSNTWKLDHWCSLVEQAEDGTPLLLMDADIVILRPLDDVWQKPFDVAYTTRPGAFPFNGGVVFVRVSDAARTFFRVWGEENRRMFVDRLYHRTWKRKYGGMNQAAFGCVLESPHRQALSILELPCAEWNCEDMSWATFDPAVCRVLHVKSELRQNVFGSGPESRQLRHLVRLWADLERAASAEASAPCGAQ
jgi:hypothetical protein